MGRFVMERTALFSKKIKNFTKETFFSLTSLSFAAQWSQFNKLYTCNLQAWALAFTRQHMKEHNKEFKNFHLRLLTMSVENIFCMRV